MGDVCVITWPSDATDQRHMVDEMRAFQVLSQETAHTIKLQFGHHYDVFHLENRHTNVISVCH